MSKKRDRCKALNIQKVDDKYVITRICPNCKKETNLTTTHPTTTCRNYFNAINNKTVCKKCVGEKLSGDKNPFYGKKHSIETKEQISNSRKGKSTGENNPMNNPEHKKKLNDIIRKKWANGEMEHVRKMFSEKLKETRRLGKIKSVIRSKIEKKHYYRNRSSRIRRRTLFTN